MKFSDGDATTSTPAIFKALEGKNVIKNPVATGAEGEDVRYCNRNKKIFEGLSIFPMNGI